MELRQYTLKPNRRETLIALFDREFVETQEATGMTVIGQFRDLDRPDMFVWLRGFEDMAARRRALTAFYEGPVWAAHKDAANATMIDSDDVLLLRPAWADAGFNLTGLQRPAIAAPGKASNENPLPGFVEISIHHLRRGAEAGFVEAFRREAAARLAAHGARLLGAFTTEHAENTFPRLPVRVDENVFITVSRFDDEAAHARHGSAPDAWPYLAKPTQTLRLAPTSRSLLR
ncbi:NIPSNAP family protein [Mesorhizobium sp. RCC_202]